MIGIVLSSLIYLFATATENNNKEKLPELLMKEEEQNYHNVYFHLSLFQTIPKLFPD